MLWCNVSSFVAVTGGVAAARALRSLSPFGFRAARLLQLVHDNVAPVMLLWSVVPCHVHATPARAPVVVRALRKRNRIQSSESSHTRGCGSCSRADVSTTRRVFTVRSHRIVLAEAISDIVSCPRWTPSPPSRYRPGDKRTHRRCSSCAGNGPECI